LLECFSVSSFRSLKVDLPDFNKKENPEEFTPEERRSWFKERGLQPVRPWHEKPFSPQTLAEVIDEYIPPEGDGKLSSLNSAVCSFILIRQKSKQILFPIIFHLGSSTKVRMAEKENHFVERTENHTEI